MMDALVRATPGGLLKRLPVPTRAGVTKAVVSC
uniref:Uncharacterized protein n=1 Tax=Caulobacter sp. (strain K31) TaxID=366602 RepID=B0T1C3_CAUSK